MKPIFRHILDRLHEPSSMAGLAGLAALMGMPAGMVEPACQLAAGLASLAAFMFPEQPK